ncbi:MAG: hypothetical protein Kow0010_27060 [Dehalococcoidia bacterium]
MLMPNLALALLVLASACGGFGGRDSTGPEELEPPSSAVPSATATPASGRRLNGIELNRLDPATLDLLLEEASEYQKALLADGDLTLEEYERAMLDNIACLRQRGFVVSGDQARLNGVFLYLPTYTYPNGSRGEGESAKRECDQEFSDVVAKAWSIVVQPVMEDIAQRSRVFMRDCLERQGVSLEQRPWSSTDAEVGAVYRACVMQTQAAFDLGYLFFGVDGQELYMD